MKTYTVDQIRIYLESKNSYGDIFFYLSEENIDEAIKQDELDKNNPEDYNGVDMP